MKQFFYFFVFLFVSCAQQTALTGGDKDITPPKLIISKTFPEPNAINFFGKEIKLVFNENITYQKSSISFIANPPIGQHELVIDKNILIIKLEDLLSENTTYTFMFANSIADLNEKNKINDLRFSFSTGAVLDSIYISGYVKNSIDKTPNLDFLVSLESTSKDSLSYISLSNSNGEYSFTHLKPGNYTLLSWSDLNNNNKLDTLNEAYGFLPNSVRVEDSCCKDIINTFIPKKPLEIEESSLNEYGKLSLLFNTSIDTLLIRNIDSVFFNEITVNNQEAVFWVEDSSNTNYQFIINVPSENFKDTIIIRKSITQDKKSKLLYKKNSTKKLFSPKNLQLLFNQELISIDTSLLVLKMDSNQLDYQYNIKNNELFITPELASGSFNLTAFPGGINGAYQEKNDTTKIYFLIAPSSNLGDLTINITNSLSANFIVQLLSNSEVVHELFSSTPDLNKKLERVIPGEYELRLILDLDANKKWTSGNIKTHTQPEEVIYLERKIVIQKNWEEFIKWDL